MDLINLSMNVLPLETIRLALSFTILQLVLQRWQRLKILRRVKFCRKLYPWMGTVKYYHLNMNVHHNSG
jgi:hypothetical protein